MREVEVEMVGVVLHAGSERRLEMLAAMGAREQLRQLQEQAGISKSLIYAYGISGDIDTLRDLAMDDSDPRRQVQAIEAIGIAGEDGTGPMLAEIYRGAKTGEVQQAAVQGLMIAGDDEVILQLYREAEDPGEKRRLLRALSTTGSDLLLEVIDEALADGQ